MALSASAPILGYPNLTSPYGWNRVSTRTFERQRPGCPLLIRKRFDALLRADAATLSNAFNTCTPIAAGDAAAVARRLSSRLSGSLAGMAESAYPITRSPAAHACDLMGGGVGAEAFRPLVLKEGTCLETSQDSNRRAEEQADEQAEEQVEEQAEEPAEEQVEEQVEEQAEEQAEEQVEEQAEEMWRWAGMNHRMDHGDARFFLNGRAGVRADLERATSLSHDAWYYLACTEIIHPIGSNNVSRACF